VHHRQIGHDFADPFAASFLVIGQDLVQRGFRRIGQRSRIHVAKRYEPVRIPLRHIQNIFVRLREIWGYDYFGETRTVDVHIRYLRQKIEDDPNRPVYIETVRGVGYRFNDKAESV
jgi:hypothetical protein